VLERRSRPRAAIEHRIGAEHDRGPVGLGAGGGDRAAVERVVPVLVVVRVASGVIAPTAPPRTAPALLVSVSARGAGGVDAAFESDDAAARQAALPPRASTTTAVASSAGSLR
jgi:hypothetical protein